MDETCLVRVESEFPPLKAADLAARPQTPTGDAAHTSGALFGGMIHPLIPFAIRGVLWYQGEQDASAHAYRTLLPLMITDWRKRWGRGEFPFIIQQLPEWNADGAGLTAWAEIREAQALTADALPHCGLSVGLGLGEAGNVHPQNKREIGRRLALVALDIAYGKPVVFSGPVFDTMTAENAVIRLNSVMGTGSGRLMAGRSWVSHRRGRQAMGSGGCED